jgi:ubiquinone/menaquinone biosynthesis C-methylase UbiE
MNKVLFLAILIAAGATAIFPGPQQHQRPSPEQSILHPMLEVVLPDFVAEGLILDIGGGGEGIVGQAKGKQVVAVDLSKRELEDAPGEPLLKIVMDARDLRFLDKTFATTTVFFTFMYIDPADHPKVLAEIYRVLRPGGRLLVWDVVFPIKTDARQRYITYPLRITLPGGRIVNTGYGVKLVEGRGARQFLELAKAAGFEVAGQQDDKGWYFVELKKKA